MPLFGVDTSSYQGAPDYAKVKASGVAFVIAKATEGLGYIDASYARSRTAIPAAGLVPGAYHFLRGTHPGSDQAEAFVQVADPHAIHALDVECLADVHATGRPLDVSGFVKRYTQLLPGHPLLRYTGRDFWHACADGISGGPLWAAGVTPNAYISGTGSLAALWAKAGQPTSGLPWGGWQAWTVIQFTDKAIVPGIDGPVDGDAFGGTLDQLRALTGQETDMPLTPDDAALVARAVHNQKLFASDTTIGQAIYATFQRPAPVIPAVPTAADIAAVIVAQFKTLPAGTASLADADVAKVVAAVLDGLATRLVR